MSDTVIEEKLGSPKADEWAERIAAQQRSGISVAVLQGARVSEYSFYAWSKRLHESGSVRFALVETRVRLQERTAEAAMELVLTTVAPQVDGSDCVRNPGVRSGQPRSQRVGNEKHAGRKVGLRWTLGFTLNRNVLRPREEWSPSGA